MRRLLIIILVFTILPLQVNAMDYTAPEPDGIGETYMPDEVESFSDGLWKIFTQAVHLMQPSVASCARLCATLIACCLILSVMNAFSGAQKRVITLAGCVMIGLLLFRSSNTLVALAVQTVKELSDYGKMLLPVMTGALAAQGAASTSGALYVGTAVFDAAVSSSIANWMTPLVYIYLILSVGNSATGEDSLKKLRDAVKWLCTWALKIALYVFTGYMAMTRVISGSVDAAALKATKLTISGMVPVIGGILSDASEAVLVSAGVIKNGVGIYGALAVIAICVEPFMRIGIQYLLLKATASICDILGSKECVDLIKTFSNAMGLLLAMCGTICLMLMISIVCFMKGVA